MNKTTKTHQRWISEYQSNLECDPELGTPTCGCGSGNTCVKWVRVRKYLSELGVATCVDGFIPENIFYRLAMKAKN